MRYVVETRRSWCEACEYGAETRSGALLIMDQMINNPEKVLSFNYQSGEWEAKPLSWVRVMEVDDSESATKEWSESKGRVSQIAPYYDRRKSRIIAGWNTNLGHLEGPIEFGNEEFWLPPKKQGAI